MHVRFAVLALGFVATGLAAQAPAVTISTVPVGNAGNPGQVETQGTFGRVDYEYRIAATEVTNAQYVEFLNAKAAPSDPLELYNPSMASGVGGITRDGSSGSYSYATIAGRENLPVNWVNWYDTIRFANWLHNGQGSGDTETGSYTILGGTPTPSNGLSITRNPGATWVLTSENEWYKAAFHKNDGVTGNYFEYPTASDTAPTMSAPSEGSNLANYDLVVNDLTEVGSYTGSTSPYGTFDQAGNIYEWNETVVSDSVRSLRGGSYNAADTTGMTASIRALLDPTTELIQVGFRVARVPEPSTAMLAMLAGGILLWWRRRI